MIVVLLNSYVALLALFVWLRFIPLNLFWKLSPVIVLLLLLVGLFIPMGWGAPSGPVAVVRNSVEIVPSVAGEVIDVPVAANVPVKAGDVLFRIDPTQYQAQIPIDLLRAYPWQPLSDRTRCPSNPTLDCREGFKNTRTRGRGSAAAGNYSRMSWEPESS